MKLLKDTVDSRIVKRPRPTKKRPQGMCLDKGCDYAEVRDTLKEFGVLVYRPLGRPARPQGVGFREGKRRSPVRRHSNK
jgi:hypothetical protein